MFGVKATESFSAEPSNSCRASRELTSLAGQQMKSGVEHRGSTIYYKQFYQSQQKVCIMENKKKSPKISLLANKDVNNHTR